MDNIVEIIEVESSRSPFDSAIPEAPPWSGQVFRVTPEARERLRKLRLDIAHWRCLTQINGSRNLQQISQKSGLSLEHGRSCIEDLKNMGLVCSTTAISVQNFLALAKKWSVDSGDINAGEIKNDANVNHLDIDDIAPLPAKTPVRAQAKVASTPPVSATQTTSVLLPESALAPATSTTTVDIIDPTPEPVTAAKPAETEVTTQDQDCYKPGKRKLSCLMQVVRQMTPDKRHSELTVYRILTGVPRKLFLRGGIDSFLFINDDTDIQDPELMHVLVSEANKVLKRDICPEMRRCASS